MKVWVLLFYIGCIGLLACKVKQPKTAYQEQTAFYTIALTKDSVTQKVLYSVKNVQVVNSKLKNIHVQDYAKEPNFLEITIKDKGKNKSHTFTEHPLYKRFDLYEESGEISSKSISLQQGEVTFRVPYYTDYKKIKINETVNFKAQKTIIIKNEN